ncbi:MerR family transcriptional regulator [Paenibacillus sp. J2TS4]|uniref:MerR family transcriptional regulator n=1 Tax=Paenibacillus sp. J2TS4 TaxID=2807194 RepID=UPI001B26AE34|nr:MerR family transcriptional regulator [Paenibacillus sp. J2TS4]GIP31587.1 hypothetical protein J2TS4_07970 [Paenibacillus sp. J2TS4]
MLIHEVCKKCSLTKKAIEYYEKQGLVHPEVGGNGYRNYSDKDLSLLKEISVLRRTSRWQMNYLLRSIRKRPNFIKRIEFRRYES